MYAKYYTALKHFLRFYKNKVYIEYHFRIFFITCMVVFFIAMAITWVGDTNICSFGDGIWWAIVTFTTVGYGDLYPSGAEGRFLGFSLMVAGFIFTSIVSGIVASIFVERRMGAAQGLKEVKMKNHIVICGWNDSAENILQCLPKALGTSYLDIVLVNQHNSDMVGELKAKYSELNISFVRGRFFDEDVLKRANIMEASAAIVLSDDEPAGAGNKVDNADERAILGAFTIKSLAPGVKLCVEINRRENMTHLKRAEVDEVIIKGEFLGFLLSSAVFSSGVIGTVREMLTFQEGSTIYERHIPDSFIGQKFVSLSNYFKSSQSAILIGILSEEKNIALRDLLGEDLGVVDQFIKQKFLEVADGHFDREKVEQKIKLNPGDDYLVKRADKAILILKE